MIGWSQKWERGERGKGRERKSKRKQRNNGSKRDGEKVN
jgi:hypothetical protein